MKFSKHAAIVTAALVPFAGAATVQAAPKPVKPTNQIITLKAAGGSTQCPLDQAALIKQYALTPYASTQTAVCAMADELTVSQINALKLDSRVASVVADGGVYSRSSWSKTF